MKNGQHLLEVTIICGTYTGLIYMYELNNGYVHQMLTIFHKTCKLRTNSIFHKSWLFPANSICHKSHLISPNPNNSSGENSAGQMQHKVFSYIELGGKEDIKSAFIIATCGVPSMSHIH